MYSCIFRSKWISSSILLLVHVQYEEDYEVLVHVTGCMTGLFQVQTGSSMKGLPSSGAGAKPGTKSSAPATSSTSSTPSTAVSLTSRLVPRSPSNVVPYDSRVQHLRQIYKEYYQRYKSIDVAIERVRLPTALTSLLFRLYCNQAGYSLERFFCSIVSLVHLLHHILV